MLQHLIVIGGGAAGFFCAINAARINPQLTVTIVERSSKLLAKVRISGGGRCNVTHACFDIVEMSRKYPRGGNFVKKSFHQFFTTDTIRWFEERNVSLKTEDDGRMFPVTDSSQTIIDCLVREANRFGIEIRMNAEVSALTHHDGKINIHLVNGQQMVADYVCVACGGFPKVQMFDWLKNTGHNIAEPVPSLFTFNLQAHPVTKLMGVSVENVKIRVANTKLNDEGPLLITHWGFSGPVILRLSAWGARQLAMVNWQFSIFINWVPKYNEQSLQDELRQIRNTSGSAKVAGRNAFGLPQRLWEFVVDQSGIGPQSRWADLKSVEQNLLVRNLVSCEFNIRGKTTYKEEFVTAGGIHLAEIDVNTMSSKIVPGLFFAGEVMDVDGVTGGFNFQHAWTSGFIAANAIAKLSLQTR